MLTLNSVIRTLVVLTSLAGSQLCAAASSLTLADSPLFVGTRATPMVMLNTSRDHQLFYKAYNDYSDIDGNGTLDSYETTYLHSFNYYGYFDSFKCYTYSTALSRFVPASITTDKYCSGAWSGNFLNWISMSRLDVMRKVLYGGYRSTDSASSSSTASLTVLERASIPTDAHAWAKYYNGSDINKLTPFTGLPNAIATVAGKVNSVSGNAVASVKNVTGTFYPGDQIRITSGTKLSFGVVNTYVGTNLALHALSKTGNFANNENVSVENLSRTGISFCNATIGGGADKSESTTAAPLIRAAAGNYSLWGANERWQCYWRDEKDGGASDSTPAASNGNAFAASGIPGARRNPKKSETGLATSGVYDYVARVEVCKSSLLGQENCKPYGNNYKPAGLLQTYGEGRVPRLLFGLMTPSYTLNVSGGVLRKAVGKSLAGNVQADGVTADPDYDEINPDTGVFKTDISKPGGVGIIYNLNKLRIDNYQYSDGTYANCTFQRTGIVPVGTAAAGNQVTEGNCSSWGNPMSELYMESLRYFMGTTPTAAFTATPMGRDNAVGLKQVTTWTDPITKDNYCAPLSVLVFNASVSTNDNDQLSGFSALKGSPNAVTQTNAVGTSEGLNGKSVFIGNNGTTNNGICTAKAVSSLGALGGLCPEAPSQAGTYMMAGMAYYSHVNRIRNVTGASIDDTKDTTSLRVNTYGVALATNVPRIPIKVSGKTVYIQPTYRLDLGGNGVGTGAIVDFKVVSQDATSGTFYVNWEDSNFGGDYDQDVIGTISYKILSATQIQITTKVIAQSTGSPQGFGYVISGTNRDGPHFHSGIFNFNFTDPTLALGCTNCNETDAATSVTYNVTGTSSVADLKDPLYYAAKYGGFKEYTSAGTPTTISITSVPDQVIEWDAQKTDGSAGADGLPDNYFYVNNPGQLEKSLSAAFKAISQSAGGAAVATSSTSFDTGTTVFQGIFDPGYWTGDLLAYDLKLISGSFQTTKLWSAAAKLTSSAGRIIFTANPTTNTGIPFQWSNLSTTQKSALELVPAISPAPPTDQGVVDYIRGSSAKEGSGLNSFRVRDTTKLGDIVNSAPVMIGTPGTYGAVPSVPTAYSSDATYSGFSPSRKQIIYVGANDGMLHAFDASSGASGGTELFAYVPSMVMGNLKQLVNPAYTHRYYVDGSPVAADVKLPSTGSGWRTVLTSALGAGGKGLFALDVTTPDASSESAIKDALLWEFTAAQDNGVGYIFQRPMVTRLKGGDWAVVTGNGYNSVTGSAQLLIIYLDQKGVAAPKYLKIDTLIGSSTDANGLGGVTGIDTDADGYVDYVYGGDLKGNLWKFDLTGHVYGNSASVTFSKLAIACTTATASCPASNLQPITNTPAVSAHPTNSKQVLVYFGTGKYFETSDSSNTQTQSMYGVWDKTVDDNGNKVTTTLETRDKLLTQTITTDPTNSNYRQVTTLPIDWAVHGGWVESFPDSGERITGTPILFRNGLIYNTFVPSALSCGTTAGYGWLMAVNYLNGSNYGAFDINGDGKIDDTELAVGSKSNTIGGSTMGSGEGQEIGALGSNINGSLASTRLRCVGAHCPQPPGGTTPGEPKRLSWREVIKPE